MKPNPKNRYNGRYNNRNTRTMITRNTALESSGPNGKLHGTALQLIEKYQAAAKDALIQNDLVLAQTCLQYADHYTRIQNIAIANDMAMRAQQQNSTGNNTKVVDETDSTPVVDSETTTDELPKFTVSEESTQLSDMTTVETVVPTLIEETNTTSEVTTQKNGKQGKRTLTARRSLQVCQSAAKTSLSPHSDISENPQSILSADTVAQPEKTETKAPVVVRRRCVRVKTVIETPAE